MTRARAAASLAVAAAAGLLVLAWAGAARAPWQDVPVPSRAEPARAFWAAYHQATARRTKRDFEGAIASYQLALQLKPDHEDSHYYLGNCLLERRAYADAVDVYRRLVAINPVGSSRGYMQWALVRASLQPEAPRDLAEAERLFSRALAVDPDSGAVLGLAEVAILRDDREGARTWLEQADADNPTSVAVPYLRGYLALRRDARIEALRLFETAVKRGEIKKPVVTWSEEGDVKADPDLRWQALARQSVFGAHWLPLRRYLQQPGPSSVDMERHYSLLQAEIAAVREADARQRRASAGVLAP